MTIAGSNTRTSIAIGLLALGISALAAAQAPPAAKNCLGAGGLGAGSPAYQSVEQLPDRRVTFRVCAPDAMAVKVISSDIADVIPTGLMPPPGPGAPAARQPPPPAGIAMIKDDQGLWSVTTSIPVAPDTYRFNFQVDGVTVPNPQGTTFSATRAGTNSTFEVQGTEGAFQAYNQDIPHGAVATIEYWSTSLGVKRRAHVYLPPGYTRNSTSYPVLYLVHGAGDSDDSWTSVGHAHYILDNLIAAGKAKPMIVVMPFGHTPDRPGANVLSNPDFTNDYFKDLIPYVEANYRTVNKANSRAMAGLSMGGAHTIYNGLTHPEMFGYIGIFSMGLMNDQQVAEYEAKNAAALTRTAKASKLVYYAIGRSDFLYQSSVPTRAMLDKYGIRYTFHESDGGHTWINWRRYLNDFVPRLFQ